MRALARKVVDILPFGLKYELFYQAGRSLGVGAYQANGSAGPLFGPMYDQSIMREYLQTKRWCSETIALIADVFQSAGEGTFYDIGANIGTVVLPISANPNVRCVAFEPCPGNFQLLKGNIALQGAPIEVRQQAVADRAGRMGFTVDSYNSGDHRLARDGEVMVDVVALDDLPAPRGTFVVKIDTQGAEPAIFQGGEKTLAGAKLIVAEFWPWAMRRLGLEPDPIYVFMRKHFELGYILQHRGRVKNPVPVEDVIEDLQKIAARGREMDQVDLVLVR